MTIEQFEKANKIVEELELTRNREKSLSELMGFVLRRDESEEYIGIGTCGYSYGFTSAFEREHFTKFLKVEISRIENKISRLNKELEEL